MFDKGIYGGVYLSQILERCVAHAKEYYDGHFTLLRFTGNWRFCFGTVSELNPLIASRMAKGTTMDEALENGLAMDVNVYEIMDEVVEMDTEAQIQYMFKEMGLNRQGERVGRNAPCVCGSGKKYKKCCGR